MEQYSLYELIQPENELFKSWDDLILKIQNHPCSDDNLLTLTHIYSKAYDTQEYQDNLLTENNAEDIGLTYDIRQFAVNKIITYIINKNQRSK